MEWLIVESQALCQSSATHIQSVTTTISLLQYCNYYQSTTTVISITTAK